MAERERVCGADLPDGGKCPRTDFPPHPRGGPGLYCFWHTSTYLECECCGAMYCSSPAETARAEVTPVQRREQGPDFVGFPLCPECVDHDLYSCQHEHDDEEEDS
jgi:hypothetical protein